VWTLVYIVFIGLELESKVIDTYETMFDCFYAREILSAKAGGSDGYFPPNSQAVCVFRDNKSL